MPMKADLSFSYFGIFTIISYERSSLLLANDKELGTLGHFMFRFLTPLLILTFGGQFLNFDKCFANFGVEIFPHQLWQAFAVIHQGFINRSDSASTTMID